MDNCIFCKIINNVIPSHKVFEDDDVVAILDAFPTAAGHVLILPKKHYKNILECDENTLSKMMSLVKEIGNALLKTYALGINVISNINTVAGQSVMHAHIHLIPVNENGQKVEIKYDSLKDLDLASICQNIKNVM